MKYFSWNTAFFLLVSLFITNTMTAQSKSNPNLKPVVEVPQGKGVVMLKGIKVTYTNTAKAFSLTEANGMKLTTIKDKDALSAKLKKLGKGAVGFDDTITLGKPKDFYQKEDTPLVAFDSKGNLGYVSLKCDVDIRREVFQNATHIIIVARTPPSANGLKMRYQVIKK